MKTPFFSVCIPTYNRAPSLSRAIKNVLNQSFDDYEIIISDNASQDNTQEVAKRFKDSRIRYVRNHSNIGMVKNWNKPLTLAKGEYVAMLFDDDGFAPNHLKEAYTILYDHKDVGIYAVGNQNTQRPITGFMKSQAYFQYIYSIKNVSTPSETIFKRTHKNKPYLYNDRYVYCPEVELYLEIASDGFDAYLSPLQTVLRHGNETANNRQKALTWIPFADKFKIIDKYRKHPYVDKKEFTKAFRFNLLNAFKTYIEAKFQRKGEPEKIFQGIKMVTKGELPLTYAALRAGKGMVDIMSILPVVDITKIKRLYHRIKQS